jgi:hypothetical protein
MKKVILIFFLFQSLVFAKSISFSESIETCVEEAILWEQFEESMTNSEDSWLWPSRASQVRGEGMSEQAVIRVTYPFGLVSRTYDYTLSDITPFKSFTYLASKNNHPFTGGATVSLSRLNSKTIIKWTGFYQLEANQWLQNIIFSRFSKNFFRELKQRIKRFEKSQGC